MKNKTCMNCKFYKVEDAQSGFCRVDPNRAAGTGHGPMVRHDHCCGQWADCGQNYYIRLGWLKARAQQESAKTRQ